MNGVADQTLGREVSVDRPEEVFCSVSEQQFVTVYGQITVKNRLSCNERIHGVESLMKCFSDVLRGSTTHSERVKAYFCVYIQVREYPYFSDVLTNRAEQNDSFFCMS